MKELFLEICEEEGISIQFLSKDWICVLEKNGIRKFISGYKFGLNDHALGLVMDDKYALYELLNYYHIPVIKHHLFYGEQVKESYANGCNTLERIKETFSLYKNNVVLKVNDGTCGKDVYHVTEEKELERLYFLLTKKKFSISLCPYYEIENEYRVIVLNGKVEFLYKKEKPFIYGDGKSTIKELLCAFNPSYFTKRKESLDTRILEKGESYLYDWKFNLSCGARMSTSISSSIKKQLSSLALLASSTIGMNFGSVDIVKVLDEYYILEMNSGVMMKHMAEYSEEMKKYAKEIYRKAILSYFAKND